MLGYVSCLNPCNSHMHVLLIISRPHPQIVIENRNANYSHIMVLGGSPSAPTTAFSDPIQNALPFFPSQRSRRRSIYFGVSTQANFPRCHLPLPLPLSFPLLLPPRNTQLFLALPPSRRSFCHPPAALQAACPRVGQARHNADPVPRAA